MSLVRIPPPRPNLWRCANFPPPDAFIRGSDGEQHRRTSKRTYRQNEEDTYEDIFGTSALALAGRSRCKIEADDTKARVFGECEISAPDHEFCLPVLTNFECRNPRITPRTWEQYSRNSCLNRTPLELRTILENEEGPINWNCNGCNGCPRHPPIPSQLVSCRQPATDRGRQSCCNTCLQYLPFCNRLLEETNFKCLRNNPAGIYWLGDEKETGRCCRVCGQTCLGRNALDFAEARCPPVELPNQLFWLGNPGCGATSPLLRSRGSSWTSVESWPFGGFSKQPCRDTTSASFSSRPVPTGANFSRPPKGPLTRRDYESPKSQSQTEISVNTISYDAMNSVSTMSRVSRREPSQTKTVPDMNKSPQMDVKQSNTQIDDKPNKSKTVVINTASSECDYQTPNCPKENNEC